MFSTSALQANKAMLAATLVLALYAIVMAAGIFSSTTSSIRSCFRFQHNVRRRT